MSVFSGRSGPDDHTATAGRAMLSDVSSDIGYLPAAIVDWADTYSWLLDDIASSWLGTGESPRRADLQQTLMAAGHDVYLAGILHDMPTPLGWVESQDQRVVISLFGLRATPCMQQTLTGLGPLVALAVTRYRQSGSRASISVGDVERGFAIDGRGAAALADRLFTELPFLGSQVPGDPFLSNPRRKARAALDFSSVDARHSLRCAIAVSDRRGPRPSPGSPERPMRHQ